MASCLLSLLFACVPVPAEADSGMHLSLSGDRLSGTARAPLSRILADLSRMTRVPVYLESALEAEFAREVVGATFSAVSLEAALQQLLQNRNFMFVYSEGRLAEVRVYADGKGQFHRVAAGAAPVAARPAPQPRGDPAPGGGTSETVEKARLRSEALRSSDPARRATALDDLAATGDEQMAMDTALMVLERERDPHVIENALEHLSGQDSVRLDPLMGLAASDRPSAVRTRALEILSEHSERDDRVVPFLQRLARRDRDEEVRETAQRLLRQLGDE
jgi:hypothetical protein